MRKCSDSHEFQLGVPPRVYEGDESFLVSRVFPENHNRPREIDIYIYFRSFSFCSVPLVVSTAFSGMRGIETRGFYMI